MPIPKILAPAFCSFLSLGLTACSAHLLEPGVEAPNFTLPSQENLPVSLTDYRGKWVVLYFYPKDESGACSKEAHSFQRDLPRYEELHAVVLGVSTNSVESHRSWCTKDGFSFKLLADPEHKVIDAYGVPLTGVGKFSFAARDTFLISPVGKVARSWQVKDIDPHSATVLATIASSQP